MMAKGDSSDILMKFVLRGQRQAIPGESSTQLQLPGKRNNNPLLQGFEQYRVFEIDSFRFSAGVSDDSDSKPKPGQAGQPAPQPVRGPTVAGRPGTPPAAQAQPALAGQFLGWRNGRSDVGYGVQIGPISFTRSIDRTSMSLLQYCIACTTFESAALVKRKATGSAAAGEPFLRMDFTDGVLLTEVSWSNDEPVTETCQFIARSIKVQYRPQLPNGLLGISRQGVWTNRPGETSS